MNLANLEAAWERYRARQARYERAADAVATQVKDIAILAGIPCAVSGRSKTPAEFVKKALRKKEQGYLDDPWNKTTDKAGARAVVPLLEHVDALDAAILNAGSLPIRERIDSRVGDPQQLEYRGLHLQVVAPAEDDDDELIECELQLRTQAQDLWSSVVSHRFLYKPIVELPNEVQRSLYRLVSLVEMFDGEVGRAMSVIRALPGYEAAELLDLAERHYLSLVINPHYDRGLSFQVLKVLGGAIGANEWSTYGERLTSFVAERREDLGHVLTEYGDVGDGTAEFRYALMSQPESIIFFERLERAEFDLARVWRAAELPEAMLAASSSVWGKPL